MKTNEIKSIKNVYYKVLKIDVLYDNKGLNKI